MWCGRNLFYRQFSSLVSKRRYSIKVKTSSTTFAINHFDQFYSSVFENWTSIRLGLLCPHSYCAIVNSFSKSDAISEELLSLGAIKINDCLDDSSTESDPSFPVGKRPGFEATEIPKNDNESSVPSSESGDTFVPCTQLKSRQENDYFNEIEVFTPPPEFSIGVVKQKTIPFPTHLEAYIFPRGKFKDFPPPKKDVTGLFNYYLMNGSSLLPVLALDVQEDDDVGDFCSSPGGKALAIIFSLKFGKLICNDISKSRLSKLQTSLNSYLPQTKSWNRKVLLSNIDVGSWKEFDAFDKILLDVPCTNDRLSVTKDNNNIFKQDRFQERMLLPKVQTKMLSSALKALRNGGSLVYSTCSLSPLQNDGVVHQAIALVQQETNLKFEVADLSETFRPYRNIFKFADNCTYGHLVLPFLPLNYGPMYISRIIRTD